MRPLMRQFAIFIFQFPEPLAKLRIAEITRQSDIKNLSVFDGLFFKLSSTTSFARGSPIFDCQFVLLIPVARAPITESSLVMMPNPFQSAVGNRQSAMPSLISQRHQRIDFRRAPGREVTSNQGDRYQTQRDCTQRHRVGWTDSYQQARHETRQGPRAAQANSNSN